MYKSDQGFETPGNEARIWRYSDLAKFVRMLDTKKLFFASAKALTDVYEGTLTRPSLQKAVVLYAQGQDVNPERIFEFIAKIPAQMLGVNCWHLNDNESPAMWQMYARDHQGIAIQSTFDRLARSFATYETHVYIGKVKYVDYDKATIDPRDIKQWMLHKRLEFAHENELRAVTFLKDHNALGIEVACDLSVLIEKVYIAPVAPDYQIDVVRAVCKRFDFPIEITPSSLDKPTPLVAIMTGRDDPLA
jgi:hypothetical protein